MQGIIPIGNCKTTYEVLVRVIRLVEKGAVSI